MIRFIVGDVEIYKKVEKEIDDAVNCGAITFPLSYSDAGKLSYFQVRLIYALLNDIGLQLPGMPEGNAPFTSTCECGGKQNSAASDELGRFRGRWLAQLGRAERTLLTISSPRAQKYP
jgi:hypothetical protein